MKKIDSLLTKYVDSINSGVRIDVNEILKECPDEDREELKELIAMINAFKKSYTPFEVRPQKVKKLFTTLESLRLKKQADNQKTVVNFRKDNISSDEEIKLNNKLKKLFDEEFGEG
ncbi:MAG TPA: hypothetical protein PK733_17985 [Clostridiales bacterium]|nr:hypothetical protein [Clostridiales bacterium]